MQVKRRSPSKSTVTRGIAGSKSLNLAWRAQERGNLRAVKREVQVTLRSIARSFENYSLRKQKLESLRRTINKAENSAKAQKIEEQIRQINAQITRLRAIQKLALKTAKESNIKLA